ncbi:MAG: hypothetical protein B7Y36_14335 [Novosphingobium sp. 28-62-57]|uniref:hypothetical protein n=1 Tax=unclassified Novosphingobium TaxID=2644732 RepID=UPI000BDBF739|nr:MULTISPECIES: hypothetical protein [unclassified Novosphingobium]OYW48493.1 MAG: hypothetical protein B7Z34_13875 [Novosphingobium sp. 12-62-10]OYZ39090.1 MAG: hypothetical protein B7Y31_08675 [Novosphingobium sp. 16-62-11]OZA38632.1 MAG: hypothetical protein B7X92_03630 [Novosphingobium sp. 17-62-9]OYZ09341.1 MAG: hypothetical protein B7Y36_14335 [Novosphingobium sp. 28-62-57]HQS69701.1 hypothetical protein [Novosphingobium sp.]
MDAKAYIRRETAVSTAINVVLSGAFFLVVFGLRGPVPVWSAGGYVFDFGPQGFMIGLMATLVPGLLARKARASGKVRQMDGTSALPAAIAVRAILCGTVGATAGMGGSAVLLWASGAAQLDWLTALLIKLLFGAVLAIIVTPAGLRAELIKR